MSCRSCRKQLSAYMDGELPANESGAVEAHVERCDDCAAALAEMKAALSQLDVAPGLEPTADFDARFSRRLQQERAGQQAGEREEGFWARWRWPAVALAASAVCAALLVVVVNQDVSQLDAVAPSELQLVDRLELLRDYEVISQLDGLEDFEVVAQLDELIEGGQR